MVTAYGDSSERCKIGSWRGAAWPRSGTVVTVRCTARTGAAVNTRFTATYAYATAASASSTGGGAYLWSDRPAPSLDVPYTPNTAYQLNTTGQQNTVTRLRTGYYVVRIEGLSQLTGLVVVATGGSAGTYCGTVAGKAAVTYFLAYLQCSAPDGQPADSAFALTFVESGNTMFAPVTGSAYAFIFCYEDFSDEFGGPRTCQSADGEPLPPVHRRRGFHRGSTRSTCRPTCPPATFRSRRTVGIRNSPTQGGARSCTGSGTRSLCSASTSRETHRHGAPTSLCPSCPDRRFGSTECCARNDRASV